MTYFAVTAQYPIFYGLDGLPLENGYVYIGEQGKNPITDPITVYWDDGLLYPAAQPIRTLGGAPNRNGSPAPVFVAGEFSILVQDKNQNQVYYSAAGIKNYTAATIDDRRNYVMNGDFSIFQRDITATPPIPDRWQFITTNFTADLTPNVFVQTDSTIDTNPRAWVNVTKQGSSGGTDDQVRFITILEDISIFSGKNIILSFYAKSSATSKIATSFDLLKSSSFTSTAYYSQGLGVTTHSLTADWTLYTVICSIPKIANTGGEGIPDYRDSGLIINIWLVAGSDYDSQTNSLGIFEGGDTDITDVRVNLGTQRITVNDRSWQEELELCQRYYEKSYNYTNRPGLNSNNGSVFFTAANTDEFTPSHHFMVRKRISTPTVTIYSPSAADQSAEVWRIGTGDIGVVSADVNESAIDNIELAAVKVDGDNYRYHYTVDAEFSL